MFVHGVVQLDLLGNNRDDFFIVIYPDCLIEGCVGIKLYATLGQDQLNQGQKTYGVRQTDNI